MLRKVTIFTTAFVLGLVAKSQAGIIYQTNYDSLAPGQVTPTPGSAGQDGYFDNSADYPNTYSTIQASIASSGKALLQVSPVSASNAVQTIAGRNVPSVLLAANPVVTLSVDFYSDSSNLSFANPYSATLDVQQVTGSFGTVAQVNIGAGNGLSKSQTGVNVNLSEYSAAATNNVQVPTTVGRGLTWDAWHHITLVENYATGTYVSLTVDGSFEDLSGIPLPQSFDALTSIPFLPMEIDRIDQQIVAGRFPSQATTDEVAWDNLSVTGVPEPATLGLLATSGLLLLGRRTRRRGQAGKRASPQSQKSSDLAR